MEGQFAVFSQGSCLWYVYGKLETLSQEKTLIV